ncbi:hypothetical protein BJ170DRAFT_683793 [Xylariales sp. AK1849]|nr:hypothetical protein BJ170DRAFT_683793 [Xylariales sp. AK1849]
MAGQDSTSGDFTSFYLQQATKELAEDLDKALQQGTALFSPVDQRRITDSGKKETELEAQAESSSSSDEEK